MLPNFLLRSQSITVVLGVSFTIDTNTVQLENTGKYALLDGTAFPVFSGTEQVFLNIAGIPYPVIDNNGNIVRAGQLRSGVLLRCGSIRPARYRMSFGSDGMAGLIGGGIPHFVIHDGLCCMIYNGAVGSNENETPTP